MNAGPADSPLPPSETKVASPIPKKDRLSLVISALSLAVSLGTLILNRLDAAKAGATKIATTSYQAYELGDGVGRTFVSHAMTTLGDKQAIDKVKEQLLDHARQTVQPIADRLDLRIDVASRMASADPRDEIFGARAIEDLRRDVEAVHGSSASRTFMLGYQLFYLYASTSVVKKDYPQDKAKLAGIYRPRAKAINEELASMKIVDRLPSELDSFEATLSSLMAVANAVRSKLATDRS
jgi:hypothetical protein